VIAVQSALPAVTDPVVVDGTTQAGGFVRVDGELAGAGVHGLQVAGGSTVKGLAITRFRGSGILLETGGSNTIQGNFIGTDDDGARSLGNRGDGVTVRNSTNNRIGGAGEALRNVIAGNWGNGIVISGATAAHNLITGNALGWMTWDLDRLGNQGDGLQITAAAHDNTIGSPEPDGGNTIVLNSRNGIALTGGAANNTIAGNFIGVETLSSNQSPDGQWQAAGNTLDGILVEGAPGNTIGGAATAARNVISANGNDGIELRGAAQLGTGVQGNFIGLLPSGRAAAGNQKYGIFLNESPGNTVGVGNVIAANREAGVALVGQGAAGNQVQGNCLGLDATCQAVLGAAQPYGIYLQGAPRNIIGGVQANLRNVIGNARVGIEIADPGAASNTVQGNYVGTEVTGQEPRAITEAGVRLDQAPDNIIGGSAAGQGNLIAGSQGSGIVIMGEGATRNLVRGNRIGVKADGVTALGNTLHGIHLGDSATGNAIGGTEANEGNLIAHNVRDGVFVESGTRNAILGNRIFANQEQGIDLAPGGWNPNDDGDNDDGPNKLQNAPMVTTTVGAGGTTIHGVLASQPGRTYRVEIFANPTYGSYQGEELLGAGNVTIGGDGRGSFVMNVTGARTAIAATATDPDGNTSEFSVVQIVVNRTSDEDDANIGDGVCDANPGTAGDQCTLRAAIQEANRRTGPDAVTFNIAGAGAIPIIRPGRALPAISDPIALDAITQPDSQRVILDGSAAGNNTHGLRLATGGSSLRGLLIRNFASGFGILLEGSRVELQNVTLTDNGRGLVAEGAVRLENVNISDNLGIGISNPLNDLVFDGLDNYVSGNGAYGISGLNITIRGVAIESNHCAGILARGNVVISERATINSNGANCTGGITDGINSAGSVEARNAEISHNVGAGIMVKANARLHNTKVNDNHGGGVFSYERGNITFEGDANQVNRNKANGITGYSVTASQLEVLSNDCVGIRALGKVMIDGGAVISHNGQGAACAARQGMSVDGLVRANNIEVEDNGDTGLMADGPVTLMNARLNNNAKAGLAMLLRGPLILRGYTQVNDNKANGIMAAGEVRAQNLEMIHNQCAGIVFLGQMEITGRANISRNGWDATCPSRNGIHAVQTDLVKAHNLTADSNGGWGIMAGQDVVLTNGRICSNGMGGIFANRNVTLTGVQVCSNQGSGVISGGDVISSTVNALNNLAAGPSEGASSLTFSQIANNTGDGIRLELPTTLTVTRTNIAGNAGLGVNNAVTTILESRLQPARSGERPAKASIPNVVMVDARGNWWGAVSGPGGAGPGAGDRVSAGVMFMPWRTTPVALVALPADDPLIAPIGVPITAAIYLRNWVAPTDTVRVQFRDAAGWLVAPTVVTVTLADETLGGTALVTITVPAGTAVGANDIVTATATSQISPTVTATAVFRVSAAHFADLSLEKRGPLAATTGEPFIYTLIVRNAGPHAATGVILTDTLPVTVTLAAVVATQGACNGAGTIVCTLATISATATATVSLTVTPYASGALWNTALATADALDPAPWNNTDAALTQSWAAPRQLYLPLVLRQ
jgi:uncharacterized repeat protein (TIGR01451 family)/CSLREA domain-containing protein